MDSDLTWAKIFYFKPLDPDSCEFKESYYRIIEDPNSFFYEGFIMIDLLDYQYIYPTTDVLTLLDYLDEHGSIKIIDKFLLTPL